MKNQKIKILFIASHRKDRAPGQRFRFEQFFDYLEKNNFQCHLSYIVTPEDDACLYQKGKLLKKVLFTLRSFAKRWKDVRCANQYDIIFLFREALMTRSIFFEKKFRKSKAKIIFDYDDAVWLMDVSEGNKHWKWLKNPSKTSDIIKLSDMIFAGNPYLSDYAKQFNGNVKIVPTTIDTSYHKKILVPKDDKKICIGWTGSLTTIKYFKIAEPLLERIKNKYGDRVYFKVIGTDTYINEKLGIKSIPWQLKTEIEDLSEIDIGIMPLPPDEWAKGKCGFKGLQYMALEIATVMSPVGVNTEIINDGVNGFLADGEDEWFEKLSLLIESEELRKTLGIRGKETIEKHYSFNAWKDKYIEYFNELLQK